MAKKDEKPKMPLLEALHKNSKLSLYVNMKGKLRSSLTDEEKEVAEKYIKKLGYDWGEIA